MLNDRVSVINLTIFKSTAVNINTLNSLNRQIAQVFIIFSINYELKLARDFLEKVQTDLVYIILNILLIKAKQTDSS